MQCKLCGRELASEATYCGFCEQVASGMAKKVEALDRPVLRLTVGSEGASSPHEYEKPTKSAECPDCGHTIFKVIGPKFDEPHEPNMLIVACTGCGFKGRMRWQGVARTTLTLKAPPPSDPRPFAEFATEDRELAEAGMLEYVEGLAAEDHP